MFCFYAGGRGQFIRKMNFRPANFRSVIGATREDAAKQDFGVCIVAGKSLCRFKGMNPYGAFSVAAGLVRRVGFSSGA